MENLFGLRLNSARKAKGLSMEKLANQIKVSKQMISKYENGKSMPDSPNLIALAKVDGEFHVTEKMFIKGIAKILDFDLEDLKELME